ncbi:MAG: hypothetical protein M1833_000147 [Piccolia ochrophora]|nr:MAG: hypothetical protein M1833_000147 [Piccolia ochrophora]
MPFIRHTPECLIARSDSKDPATTCKGITANGRPCRRALAASVRAASRGQNGHTVAVVLDEDGGPTAAFCWQHRDQAVDLANKNATGVQNLDTLLKRRTSVDTLLGRLGLLHIEDAPVNNNSKKRRQPTLTKGRNNGHDPTLPNAPIHGKGLARPAKPLQRHQRNSTGKTQFSLLEFFCCVERRRHRDYRGSRPVAHHGTSIPDHLVSSRIHENPRRTAGVTATQPPSVSQQNSTFSGRVPVPSRASQAIGTSPVPPQSGLIAGDLLTFVPKTLTPQTTSLLLAELEKPLSASDEKGYIYMFWLTDAAARGTPSDETVSALLTPSSKIERPPGQRRVSELLRDYATNPGESGCSDDDDRILLKIGRASNVQRRMNEWTRQCGYNLSVLRFYPHVPTSILQASSSSHLSAGSTPPPSPRKVPFVHRVERLIHIELAQNKVKKRCDMCAKEHREWFSIPATRNHVKAVDEVVRRWVGWAEQHSAADQ